MKARQPVQRRPARCSSCALALCVQARVLECATCIERLFAVLDVPPAPMHARLLSLLTALLQARIVLCDALLAIDNRFAPLRPSQCAAVPQRFGYSRNVRPPADGCGAHGTASPTAAAPCLASIGLGLGSTDRANGIPSATISGLGHTKVFAHTVHTAA
jgi:hypothetical protein